MVGLDYRSGYIVDIYGYWVLFREKYHLQPVRRLVTCLYKRYSMDVKQLHQYIVALYHFVDP